MTRVAREVGTEGKLGGQANVQGARCLEGPHRQRQPARAQLTTQVRAIADVSTAVTKGDLTRKVAVERRARSDELKQNVNQMIANLRETTREQRRAGLAEHEPGALHAG